MIREVAEKVKPPRTLLVPFGWGQPLGPPGRGDLHRRVAAGALAMLETEGVRPVIRVFDGSAGEDPDPGGDEDGGGRR